MYHYLLTSLHTYGQIVCGVQFVVLGLCQVRSGLSSSSFSYRLSCSHLPQMRYGFLQMRKEKQRDISLLTVTGPNVDNKSSKLNDNTDRHSVTSNMTHWSLFCPAASQLKE